MNRIITAAAIAATSVVTVSHVSALRIEHTPRVSASCGGGVSVDLRAYEGPDDNNVVTITIAGVPETHYFGRTLAIVVPVPQEGAVTVWSVEVDANLLHGDPDRYDWATSGEVGPCGEAPTTTSTTTTTTEPTTTEPTSTSTTAPDATTTDPTPDQTTTTTTAAPIITAPTTTTPAPADTASPMTLPATL